MANDPKPQAVRSAEDRIDRATDPTRSSGSSPSDTPDSVASMEGEQQREAGSSPAQGKGILIGILAGGLVGLALAVPLAFIPFGGFALAGRLVLFGIVGVLVGSTIGVVYLGGRMPELEGETVDTGGRPSRGSTPRDPNSDARGR